MIVQRPTLFWLGLGAFFLVGLYVLRDALTPFVAGLILAYLFDPLVRRLQRAGLGRTPATAIVLGLFVFFALAALVLALPLAVREIADLMRDLPEMVTRLHTLLLERAAPVLDRLGSKSTGLKQLEGSLGDLAREAGSWVLSAVDSLWTQGRAVVSLLGLMLVAPVVAFFLLLDWDRLFERLDAWLPRRHHDTIVRLASEMNALVAAFLRGQALVCLILGTYYAVALPLAGLRSGFLIGCLSGAASFIPYVGAIAALAVATIVATAQFAPDWTMVGVIVGIVLAGQFVEGNFISPRIVGHAVGLHPVWVMFALFAFGSLAGFFGMMIAVPVAAAIGVLTRYGLTLYLTSPLYRGEGTDGPGPRPVAERPAQLALDFPVEPRLEAEDFLVSASNEQAYLAVEAWPAWADPMLVLIGPEGAGKSHLAAIFAAKAHAWTVPVGEVTEARVPHLASAGALVVEDADAGRRDEAALFHLTNRVRAQHGSLLVTARTAPDTWGLSTPDLVSRLRLATMAAIGPPDDALLRAVLVKLFLDRQLIVDTAVVDTIVTRGERSFAALHAAVERLDRAALAAGRRVTRALALAVLADAERGEGG